MGKWLGSSLYYMSVNLERDDFASSSSLCCMVFVCQRDEPMLSYMRNGSTPSVLWAREFRSARDFLTSGLARD